MDSYKDKIPAEHRTVIIGGLVLSVFILAISFSLATNRVSFLGSAQTYSSVARVSKDNSYVFASPVSASADGKSGIRITVFVLDSQGLGIEGVLVDLDIPSEIAIHKAEPSTDGLGRATFDLTSSTPSTYKISAQVEGATLPQTVSISFL